MAKPRTGSGLRSLTRDDMVTLLGPAQKNLILSPDKIRDSHHMVARYAARGMKNIEIADATGYSAVRVGTILQSPAMADLVSKYRDMVDEAFRAEAKEDFDMGRSAWRKAQRLRLDKLEAAECGELDISLRELNSIAMDGEDRYGTSKKSTNINLNADFAAELEAALARSNRAVDHKIIEVEATPDGIRRRV